MTEPTTIVADCGEVHLQAQKGDRPPRFTMAAYSGGRMRPQGFSVDVVVDLAGLTIPEQAIPSYLDHDRTRRVGHTTRIVNDKQRLVAEGLVSGSGPDAVEVRESAARGFPWKSSIGTSIEEREFVQAGQSIRVNGRDFSGPLVVVHRATLREVSFVSLAGDPATSAHVTAKDGTMPDEPTNQRTDDDIRREERERLERIDLACGGEWGEFGPVVTDLRAQATAGAMTVGELEASVDRLHARIQRERLVTLRASRPAATLPGGQGQPEMGQVLEAALSLAVGVPEEVVARDCDGRVMNAALSSENRGIGLQSIFHEVIRAAGRHVPGRGMTNDVIRAAFEADVQLRASSGFSTVSLPGILGNVANKAMLASYEKVATSWHEFCHVSSNRDFKPHKRYRLNEIGQFQQVGADGELKHLTLDEQEYESQLDTWGALLTLTRQMIVNDDADAFLVLPRAIGRLSAVQLERLVYELLLSNANSFFSIGNKNLLTGSGSALGIDGLTDAETTFDNRVDPNGNPLLAVAEVLLVPTTLKTTARQLVRETTAEVVPAQPANAGTDGERTIPGGNPHAGKFKVVPTPWLNNTELLGTDGQALTGQSDDHWYLLVGPGDMAVIDVAFLDGRRMPTVEQGDTSFNTLGMAWRSYHDFAVAQGDDRGGVRSAGS